MPRKYIQSEDRDKRLCNLGYDTSNTEVLMQFQSEFNLSTTGEADPETCHDGYD